MFRSREIRDGEFDGEETAPPQKDSGRRDTFPIDLDQFGVQSLVCHAYFEQEQHPCYCVMCRQALVVLSKLWF